MFLQPQSEVSIHDAVQSILTHLPADKPYSDEGFALAALVVEVAVQIPYQHPSQARLVRLLKYLTRSRSTVGGGGGRRSFVSTSRPWASSSETTSKVSHWPTAKCRDILCRVKQAHLTKGPGPEADETPLEWVNYHAFLAQLEAAGVWTARMPTFAV